MDLVEPAEVPEGCKFWRMNVLGIWDVNFQGFQPDFICASSPCEQFSLHGMKHFHPNPPYPEVGIKLFNHTRAICEASGFPYVMENVRAAQQFVGNAVHHCGPFYLWGNAVPPLMPQGIEKNHAAPGMTGGWLSGTQVKLLSPEERRAYRDKCEWGKLGGGSKARREATAHVATIPNELATCVADYAERLLEQTHMSKSELLGSGPIPSGQSSENER